ncbi:DUF4397 domain-containing protein [Cytobacillus massiliigabonensis]|uniref:DUF4397 domain-containing protein n=1 Tax=Cytobacillus massiliigabonensis TaxID=1871011 RepID=UPI000C814E01|nr:DUF4397 domain-containing protein [Cytobacillus massiliigabonensis]
MSLNRNQENHFQKAAHYDLLANYYKYIDPAMHIAFYQKHLKYMTLAAHSMRTHMNLPQNGAVHPAKIRFVHGSNDASNVDIYVNGSRILKDFPFKEASTYLSLPAGKYQVDIYPAGNMVSTVLSRKIIVGQGKNYTFLFSGTGKSLKWLALEDEHHVPHGETKLRFIHLADDAPAFDIAVKDRDVIFPNIAYRKFTSYLGLSPMTVDLEARIAGSKNVVLSIPHVRLEPNKVYSIFFIGSVADGPELEAIMFEG